MTKSCLEIFKMNCFCSDAVDSGNPAAVITNFIGNDSERQYIAKRLAKPVTVFLTSTDELPNIKFFYPDTQMPLCLHGTLAAGKLLFGDKNQQQITCLTDEGKSLCISKSEDECLQVKVSVQKFDNFNVDTNIVGKMLHLNDCHDISRDLPFFVSSVGSPKLLVPLKSLKLLSNLKPNFALIKQWSLENKVNGLYVYSNETTWDNSNYHARGFNPKTGHNEDAATGVAAGALGLALKKNIKVQQGLTMSNPCLISVTYKNPSEIFVGGKVSAFQRLPNFF